MADDPQSFAEQVIHLLRTPLERSRLGSAARTFVEMRYAWSVIGQQLHTPYEQARELSRKRLAGT